MSKHIDLISKSTPTNPKLGYGDFYMVIKDGKVLQQEECSSCPNPFQPSTLKPWDKAYAWIAPAENIGWECVVSEKFGKCLVLNVGGPVTTRYPNPNQNGAMFARSVCCLRFGEDPRPA